METRIITTDHNGSKGKKHGKKFAKRLTRKTARKHKGYPMKGVVKAHMTYKRGKKR